MDVSVANLGFFFLAFDFTKIIYKFSVNYEYYFER